MRDVRIQVTCQCPWCEGRQTFAAPWDAEDTVTCDHCTDGRVPWELTLAELAELLKEHTATGEPT